MAILRNYVSGSSAMLDLKFPTGINNGPLVYRDVKKISRKNFDAVGEADLNNSALDVQGILLASRGRDIERMAKLVIAKPGLTYNVKQGLSAFLQAADAKALGKKGTKLLSYAKDILLTNVTNVAQVAGNGLGLHLPKGAFKSNDATSAGFIYQDDKQGAKATAIKSPGHTDAVSRGVAKSKKLPYDGTTGLIDYTKKVEEFNLNVGDSVSGTKVFEGDKLETDLSPDIIPFYFKFFGDDSGEIMDTIQFRAYLDSFSDDYNASWNKTQYLGRPEMFKNYQGFERMINFSFKAAAESRADLLPIHRKLQVLTSATAPTFSGTKNEPKLFMRGTLAKVTIGDYLINQPGNITSVQLAWEQDYPWEIDRNKPDTLILPHVLNVTVSMEAIHNFVPEYQGTSRYLYPNTFIAPGEALDEKGRAQKAAVASLMNFASRYGA